MTRRARRRAQRGFTLIEFLVTTVVLVLGMLGVAGMQVYGLKSAQEAMLRMQATVQAQDLAERMRANRGAAEAGSYAFSAAPSSPPDCVAGACTPAEIAQWDIAQWLASTATTLPSGTGSASVQGGLYTITVSWAESSRTVGGSSLSFTFRPAPSPEG